MRKIMRILGAVLSLAAVLFAATVIVNPYGVWPSFADRLLPKKTERINSVRLVKAYDLLRGCPDHIITGMSTVVWGIDPQEYPVANKTLYNGGIVGSNMVEQYDYVYRYLALCPNISKVYLDIKPESFENTAISPNDFAEERLQGKMPYPNDLIFTNFSKSAIVASFLTVKNHLTGIVDQMVYDSGDGFHHLIETDDSTVYLNNFKNFISIIIKSNKRITRLNLYHLKYLINDLRRRGIEVVVYFGPMHMLFQYEYTVSGYNKPDDVLQEFDYLKREIAKMTDYYDFTLHNELTGEDIANTKMFIDQIHYRPRLGTKVLAALNGQRDGLPANFGVLVTRNSVEDVIAKEHEGIAQWARDFPEYAKEVSEKAATAGRGSLPELQFEW